MAIDAPIHTSAANLPRVLNAGLPTVLVFWRRDCKTCERLLPALNATAKSHAGKLLVAQINVTDEANVAKQYRIAQLPTVVFMQGEKEAGRGIGAIGERELAAWAQFLTAGGARPPEPSGPSEPFGAAPHRAADPPPTSSTARPAGQPGGGPKEPVVLTDANFNQVLREARVPVLVDFWAVWCGPCKMVAPHVAALAQEFAGRAIVGKLNVDENPRTAGQYGIMSIPTLLIFSNGQVVEQIVGAQQPQVLRQKLAKHVK